MHRADFSFIVHRSSDGIEWTVHSPQSAVHSQQTSNAEVFVRRRNVRRASPIFADFFSRKRTLRTRKKTSDIDLPSLGASARQDAECGIRGKSLTQRTVAAVAGGSATCDLSAGD